MDEKYVKGAEIKKKYPPAGRVVPASKVYGGYDSSIKGPSTAGMKAKGSVEVGKGSKK